MLVCICGYLVADIEFYWASEITGVATPVYMRLAYQSMLAKNDGNKSQLLKCMKGGEAVYLPLLIKELGDGYKEAYSAYGYGGLVGDVALTDADIEHMRQYLAAESILALFIRHSPFLSNQHLWPSSLAELNRYTYSATLQPSDSFDDYLKGIPQKLRWSANYAKRAGLQVTFRSMSESPADSIRAFYQLYSELMRQKQTSEYYLFSEEFFLDHCRSLQENCELAEIVDKETGTLIAGAFFLFDDTGWVHYHLSAATPDAMKLQGMELLIASALHRYGNSGYLNMHLGGGHALDESDGLSRFKSKFSTERLDFCCTKLVCDVMTYNTERVRMPLNNPKFFLISDARQG
jgi:hypothetical protein